MDSPLVSNFRRIMDVIPTEPCTHSPKRYMALGPVTPFELMLVDSWWNGVAVRSSLEECLLRTTTVEIVGTLGTDPHFVKAFSGNWIRPILLADVFTQFQGAYSAIIIAGTGMDRTLWEDKHIFDTLPKVYILREDGHNEQVEKKATDMGYIVTRDSEWMMLVHR